MSMLLRGKAPKSAQGKTQDLSMTKKSRIL